MRTIAKTVLLGFLTALCIGGNTLHARCSEMTKAWANEDKRLLTPVTFTASSLYLGELLEKVAKQTGVSVTTDDHDEASGTLITVHWTQVPLTDALNSLWSLLSYKGAEWEWEQRDAKEGATYRLLHSGAARGFGAYLKTLVFTAYDEQSTLLATAANMSPEQIKRLIKTHPDLQGCHIDDEETLLRLRVYAALPEATRRDALTNPKGVKIALTDMSAEMRDYLTKEWKDNPVFYTTQKAGEEPKSYPVPPPSYVRIKSVQENSEACPALIFCTGSGEGELGESGIGFTSVLPLNNWFKAKLKELWLLPGDTTSDALENHRLKASEEYSDAVFNGGAERSRLSRADRQRVDGLQKHMITYRLTQMAEAVPLSYTARLAHEQGINYCAIKTGMKLAALLNAMQDAEPALLHKWHNGVLVLSDCAWYHNDASAPTPYEITRMLRAAEKANNGFIPLRTLAMTASLLDAKQLKQLKPAFPLMEKVALMQDVFKLYYRDAAWEHAGATLTPALVETLTAIPHNPLAETLQDARVITARIAEIHDKKTPQLRQVEIQLLTADGMIAGRYGFYDQKRETDD